MSRRAAALRARQHPRRSSTHAIVPLGSPGGGRRAPCGRGAAQAAVHHSVCLLQTESVPSARVYICTQSPVAKIGPCRARAPSGCERGARGYRLASGAERAPSRGAGTGAAAARRRAVHRESEVDKGESESEFFFCFFFNY